MQTIRQVLVGASPQDAITQMALKLKRSSDKSLRHEIYAFHPPELGLEDDVRHIRECPSGAPDDFLLYHSSYGIPELTSWLMRRPERLGIAYHNITPSRYYVSLNPDFANGLDWGRVELERLRSRAEFAICDSTYNAHELVDLGYQHVRTFPMGVDPFRLTDLQSSSTLLGKISTRFPDGYILLVCQVLPHKRIEIAVEVVHILRTILNIEIGLVIVGPQRNHEYLESLLNFISKLPNLDVHFAGSVTDEDLVTYYRAARLFLSTSDHEGLCIPPLEAMANDVVVAVRGVGAVPETVADGGIVIDPDAGVIEIAEVAATLLENPVLRSELRERGRTRAQEFARDQKMFDLEGVLGILA